MTGNGKKKERSVISRFFIASYRISIYVLIQIAFIPFAIVGLIIAIYKENVKSKKLNVSYSAIQALQYRWIMHHFDTRPDPLSVAFTKRFPCESHFGLWSTLGALVIAQRIFGFTTRLGRLPEPGEEDMYSCSGARVFLFDRIMEKYVDEMEQIVFPGAGFDLMALTWSEAKEVRVFELDQVQTLELKTETLKDAGIQHDWITYIPVDYSKESWGEKLLEAGFEKAKKTLFIWQSVSLYLEADNVKETLREMADLCGQGSVIAQDFYSQAFLSGEISKMAQRNMGMISKMGEPWKFALDMSDDPKRAVEEFLNECGLQMTRYLQFGEKLDIEPFYCIVEAERL
jgi:methyltransferase (TIGR00027 family)